MTVYLVGAGPGDPELITLRGARLLASADVVVYDRLAEPLLSLVGSHAERIDVGKARGVSPVSQEQINAILIECGRRFESVVRLKGGDPFVFARGGEELIALKSAGIACGVVPGISSALGAPATAGISLTVRGVSQSFTVITAHEDPRNVPQKRWEALADLGGTIVVLMGAANIGALAARLVDAGLTGETPVAAIYAAATDDEQISIWSLNTVGDVQHVAPTTFVIGEVVGLRTALSHSRNSEFL